MYDGLHHVQLAMPRGEEDRARRFFGGVLGLTEIDKPPELAARGGAWFRAGRLELHLGVEDGMRPAAKAHPGILVDDLDGVVARLAADGQAVTGDDAFPGFRRIYAHDPFGNRLEFLEPVGDAVGEDHPMAGHAERAVALAAEALAAGDGPFGSVLVTAAGGACAEDRNREAGTGDGTRHPELALARWAAEHLTAEERAAATVVTSGEHCPMCAAAHAWVGLGAIVYVASSGQLAAWRREWDAPASPVAPLAVGRVAPGIRVSGPVAHLVPAVRELHRRHASRP